MPYPDLRVTVAGLAGLAGFAAKLGMERGEGVHRDIIVDIPRTGHRVDATVALLVLDRCYEFFGKVIFDSDKLPFFRCGHGTRIR